MRLIKLLFIVGLLISCSAQEQKEEYFENGQLKEQIPFKNNSLNGEYKAFYESGQLRAKGVYKNGKMTDSWKYWYKNGQLLSEALYNDEGELIDLNAWDDSGKQTIKERKGIGMVQGEPVEFIINVVSSNGGLFDYEWRYKEQNQ